MFDQDENLWRRPESIINTSLEQFGASTLPSTTTTTPPQHQQNKKKNKNKSSKSTATRHSPRHQLIKQNYHQFDAQLQNDDYRLLQHTQQQQQQQNAAAQSRQCHVRLFDFLGECAARISMGFAAGAIGGLAHQITYTVVSASSLAILLGIPSDDTIWTQQLGIWQEHIFWCSLWGILFAVPLPFKSTGYFPLWGIIVGMCSALWELLFLLPLVHHRGWFGSDISSWFWVIILLYNLAFGISGSIWFEIISRPHIKARSLSIAAQSEKDKFEGETPV